MVDLVVGVEHDDFKLPKLERFHSLLSKLSEHLKSRLKNLKVLSIEFMIAHGKYYRPITRDQSQLLHEFQIPLALVSIQFIANISHNHQP